MKTILLDSSAFIAGFEIPEGEVESYTVPLIIDEITKNSLMRLRIQIAIDSGRLSVRSPERKYIAEVDEALKMLGESGFLSIPDRDLLALALQFKEEGGAPIIFSDDYSIQNIAEYFDIKYWSASTRGIKRVFKWVIYCSGCKKTFNQLGENASCPVCGTTLKRKPLKKFNTKTKFNGASLSK
ncbi:MAG: NOB1 family endonuclease [Candidatus Bathyarchaeia archaeon]